MSEALHFFAVQITLLAIVLVLHTYLGLHVIRRTLIFSDLVLDQLAAFGALVGIGLAIRYGSPGSYLMSLAAVLVGALLLAVLKPRSPMIPREAIIGVRVKETRSEKKVAKVTVKANSRKNWPARLVMEAIGKNTTMLVRVEAITATAISEVPLPAASRRFCPICLNRNMFSSTTTELVTSMPTAVDSPIRVMMFRVNPDIWSNKKVETIE